MALATPIDTIGEERLFWVHMVQHLLIGDLAAFCLVMGLTGPLLRPLLALPAIGRLRALAHPLVALPLWAVNLYFWHLPALYDATLAHSGLHALEHSLFLASGALMWAAVAGPLPGPRWFGPGARAGYVLAVRAVGMALANVFIWAGHPLYDYGTPLSDQVTGGAIMFTEGGIVTLVAFAWLFLGWMAGAPSGRPRARQPAKIEPGKDAGRPDTRSVSGRPRTPAGDDLQPV